MAGPPSRASARMKTSLATAAISAAAITKKPGLMVAARSRRRSTFIAALLFVVVVFRSPHQLAERPAAENSDAEGQETEHTEETRQVFETDVGATDEDELHRDQHGADRGE